MNVNQFSHYDWALVAFTAFVFVAHLVIITVPLIDYVYDELLYVNDARYMLDGTPTTFSHPPLAVGVIATSMKLFGDHGIGRRLPSVIAGTFALVILYCMVRRLRDEKTAFLAAFLLGMESLWFVHSSIAMLDIIAIFFGILCIYWYVLQRYVLAGIALGLGMLSKEVILFLFPVLVAQAFFTQSRLLSWPAIKKLSRIFLMLTLPALVIVLTGFALYNATFDLDQKGFTSPLKNMKAIVVHNEYAQAFTQEWAVHPLRWFVGFTPQPYFISEMEKDDGVVRREAQYFGQPNWVILYLFWIALPFAVVQAWKKRVLERLAVLLFAIPFLLFVGVALMRPTYPFYMLLFTPAICIMNACLLSRLPKHVIEIYAFAVITWFLIWFPRTLIMF